MSESKFLSDRFRCRVPALACAGGMTATVLARGAIRAGMTTDTRHTARSSRSMSTIFRGPVELDGAIGYTAGFILILGTGLFADSN